MKLQGYKEATLPMCKSRPHTFTNYNSLKIGKPETKSLGKTPDNPKRALRENTLKGHLSLSAI